VKTYPEVPARYRRMQDATECAIADELAGLSALLGPQG
jgi:hypothetical protein